jgi:hypothetical protein
MEYSGIFGVQLEVEEVEGDTRPDEARTPAFLLAFATVEKEKRAGYSKSPAPAGRESSADIFA